MWEETTDTVDYSEGNPHFALLDEMIFEPGTKEDWDELHELHYKSTGRTSGNIYRVTLHGTLVGVCVMTLPRGLLKPRHELFPHIAATGKDTRITNVHRFKWLNKNVCLNSRTVVDTMYRGVGIAYRLLNLAARAEGKRLAEIQSSMSKYNFFAQKAGFRFAKPRNSPYYEEGIEFLSLHFDSNPMDYMSLIEEFNERPEGAQRVLTKKLREFYYYRSSLEKQGVGAKRLEKKRRVLEEMPVPQVLKNLQQLIFSSPMYGVYENPDYGRELPKQMKLTAFDNQRTSEPLLTKEAQL